MAVPLLLEVFESQGIAEIRAVPLAVGTAQASILIASITAAAAHWRAGTVDRDLVRAWLPALVGGLAAAVGVGGGTLSTPVLTLFSFSIRRAIGAGALFNLIIAVPATLFFLQMDRDVPGRPADALGDVAMFCVATLSLPALFVAPIAARWSAQAPASLLRRLFAVCLAIIAGRLLLR